MAQKSIPSKQWTQARGFTQSIQRSESQSQTAPSAQAYLSSGVIGGSQNLVDVKKVLVIGSGGLSIGQAGEFDYSGTNTFHSSDDMTFMP